MSNLSEFYFNTNCDVFQYELLQISHPNFTKTYYLCKDNVDGVTVKLENNAYQFFEYIPMSIEVQNSADNLDIELTITIADVGEIIAKEIRNIQIADNFKTYPTLTFRSYSSANLDVQLYDKLDMKIQSTTRNAEGTKLVVAPIRLNNNRIGEFYNISRFPLLNVYLN